MANSYVEHTNSGTGTNGLGQKIFTVPTNFININDIVAKGYNGSSWTELTIASRGTTTVELSAIPTGYTTLRLFRRSTTEPIVDFQTGATLSENDLETAYRQGLYVAQEVAEDADPDGGSGIGNISNSQLAGGITDDKLASGVGTSANNLVKLDSSARLPVVDGSQLTGLTSPAKWRYNSIWGSSAPTGFLACDGAAVSRTTYAALFAAIGTTWGSGDSSSTFNVPDLRGSFLRGTGSHGSSTMANGSAFSAPSVGSFENDQFQSHFHAFNRGETNAATANGGRIAHGSNGDSLTLTANVGLPEEDTTNNTGTPRNGDETRPFNAAILYVIKT